MTLKFGRNYFPFSSKGIVGFLSTCCAWPFGKLLWDPSAQEADQPTHQSCGTSPPVVVGNNARELPAGVGGGVGGGGPGSGLLFDLHGGALVGVAALFRIGALFGVG